MRCRSALFLRSRLVVFFESEDVDKYRDRRTS